MNKKLFIAILVSVVLLVVGSIVGFFGYFTAGGKTFLDRQTNGETVTSEDFVSDANDQLEAFDSLRGEAAYGDFKIVYGDHYGISMQNYTKETLPEYQVENGELLIAKSSEEEKLHFGINFGNISPAITVTVPENFECKNFNMTLESGNISLENFSAETFGLTAEYGDIALTNLTAPTADITAESGEVTVENGTIGQFSIYNEYGAISLKKVTSDTLSVNCDSGDTILDSVSAGKLGSENEYGDLKVINSTISQADLALESGELEAENTEWNGLSVKSEYGSILLDGKLLGQIDLAAESGDITLKVDGNEEDYTYELTAEAEDVTLGGKNYSGNVIAKGSLPNHITAEAAYGSVDVDFKE